MYPMDAAGREEPNLLSAPSDECCVLLTFTNISSILVAHRYSLYNGALVVSFLKVTSGWEVYSYGSEIGN